MLWQSLEEELNRRQSDIRQLTEAAGKLKEQQVLEYQALISSLTIRWQDLQRQFVDFQTRETSRTLLAGSDPSDDTSSTMGGPDFVTRVNKLREAIASVSRQMHSPPLNLKHYEQLTGQEDSVKVSDILCLIISPVVESNLIDIFLARLSSRRCTPLKVTSTRTIVKKVTQSKQLKMSSKRNRFNGSLTS